MYKIVPGIYQHFKGHKYVVLGTGKHTETEEELVIYQNIDTNEMWARPVSMWNEIIRRNEYVGPRFTLITTKVK